MYLIFDFDGTITQKDTIGELANCALALQQQKHGQDLQASWDQVVEDYMGDCRRYKSEHPVPEEARTSVDAELDYLSGMKGVEEDSLARVAESRLFAGLPPDELAQAGAQAVADGRIKLRDGFGELYALARERGWDVAVVSVNWSRGFIRGALRPHEPTIVANDPSPEGVILGPDILPGERMTNVAEKKEAVRQLARDPERRVVYFGDSTTDMECLLDGGVVISNSADSSLLNTLQRVGVSVPHVASREQDAKLVWAKDFREVLESGMLEK